MRSRQGRRFRSSWSQPSPKTFDRSRDIGWLALESLCRQKNAPPWELIVIEEPEDAMGRGAIEAYTTRLIGAGMQQMFYCEQAVREQMT